jgi:hypothetical protein
MMLAGAGGHTFNIHLNGGATIHDARMVADEVEKALSRVARARVVQ